ncbi:methyl-accepting chemotaxis protein [Shewanella sp. NIFS-20-20]|uniref:methyl-accepting chemotaxis protein n=1 Tax=Shewanella sp. NIFS-20-20 TaxID=2853806 RepID=UPI001C441E51|nr:methyl-accepting chemotaxis protein [Shewanella sp. NIFS-20-20]MBV7317039.1 methyl-accepting chemotaxis protein [Shewanella sp. NIFS-20-20]
MIALLRRFSILQRLLIMLMLAAIGTMAFASFSLWQQRENLIDQKWQQIDAQLNTVNSLLDSQATLGSTAKTATAAILQQLSYQQDGYFIVLDKDGSIVVYGQHPQWIGLDESDIIAADKSQPLVTLRQLANSSQAQIEYPHQHPSKGQIDTKLAAASYFAPWQWTVITGMYISDVNHSMTQVTWKYVWFMLALSLPIFAFFILLNLSINRPLQQAIDAMTTIAHGNGNLTLRLPEQGQDEINALALSFNAFVAKMAVTVAKLTPISQRLTVQADHLSQSANASIVSTQSVHEQTQSVATAIEQMSATTDDMATNTNLTAEAANTVSQQALASQQQMHDTVNKASALVEQLTQSMTQMTQLNQASMDIDAILDVISRVSDQTNLLALNAAIEAARAGTHGRGFAVVADEVRALANRTQASTQEITTIIQGIQAGVKAMTVMTQDNKHIATQLQKDAGNVGVAMDNILMNIEDITSRALQVASATEEQSLVSRTITQNIGAIASLSAEALSVSQDHTVNAKQLQNMSDQLTEQLQQFTLSE